LLKISEKVEPSFRRSLSIRGSYDFRTLKWWFIMKANEYSRTKMLERLIL